MPQEENATEQISALISELSGTSRRRRQEVAHKLAAVAKADPSLLVPHISELVKTLERPEAQTRWEILTALGEMAPDYSEKLSGAFDGAEEALFDDGSATTRLAAFIFLCRYGSTGPKRSEKVWPLLDEAIQCYHGDAEYRDMLQALLGLAQSKASKTVKKALADRVAFDAENATGYTKSFSKQILEVAK